VISDTITRHVPSKLPDLRGLPLADLPGLDAATLGEAVGRVIPDAEQAAPIPVAAFQSAI
jgi:FXSXX-COOH protein